MNNPDTAESHDELALFPLGVVLFPGGALPLRIFEARYIDMVSDCMRAQRPFGVVPILRGSDTGRGAEIYGRGTLATIENWDRGEDGLLHILARGQQRFGIVDHAARGDGLLLGKVVTTTEDSAAPASEFSYLGALLKDVFGARPELAPTQPWQFDNAAWLAYRLAELIPLSLDQRLEILDLDSGAAKLALVASQVEAQNLEDTDGATH